MRAHDALLHHHGRENNYGLPASIYALNTVNHCTVFSLGFSDIFHTQVFLVSYDSDQPGDIHSCRHGSLRKNKFYLVPVGSRYVGRFEIRCRKRHRHGCLPVRKRRLGTRCPVSLLISTHAHYIYGLALSNKPNCLLCGHFESLSRMMRTRLGFLLRLNEFNSPATEVEQVIRSRFGSFFTCRLMQKLRPNPRNLSAAERILLDRPNE